MNSVTQEKSIDELLAELSARRRYNLWQDCRMCLWQWHTHSFDIAKRLLDLAIGSAGFLVFLCVLPFAALLVKRSKGPVFYSQVRVKQNGQFYRCYKFRSMMEGAEERQDEIMDHNGQEDRCRFHKKADDPRITKEGRFLRSTSIDEFPQFWNVLRGDISIVGPRSPLPSEVKMYTPDGRKRLDVIGGLTCYWQTHGRSDVLFPEHLKFDKQYIKKASILQDIELVGMTIPAVLSRKGAC
ncbi:MAG: sugar transferase [Victivallales bacterium]|nr:sugar transferase [Victivallales bacterium]